ncbi:MAG: N-acetylmuramoyl-L-alanine amidase [Acidobacteria bacterium]|nr:N-acetylmuramoyl-L-alanine amidase [Acidobacteriota bacterium]
MYTRPSAFIRFFTIAIVLSAGGLALAAPAAAQTAQVRYERALAREEAARNAAPTLTALRSIATAYENIVRAYPRSGYADNALWQGAGVLQLAWERAGQARDKEQALRLLQWLRREYPSSSLVRQVSSRTAALNRPRAGAASARTPPPPAARPAAASAPAAAASADEATPGEPVTPVAAGRPVASPAALAASTGAAETSGPARSGDPITVRGLSHTALPRGDRLTFELSDETTFVAAPASASGELVLTVNDARAAAAIVTAASSVRGTLVRSLRIDNGPEGLRVTVGVAGPARHSAFPLYGPHRLVFDFEESPAQQASVPAASPSPVSAAVNLPAAVREPSAPVPAAPAAATSPADAPTVALATSPAPVDAADAPPSSTASPEPPSRIRGSYSLARQLGLGVSRIVIDPGHGGSDPGASGNGVTEAALVLDVALRLEKLLLEQPGFEVVLTRRTNAAVPLERRTAIANEESADLFLSIHANSSPRRETAGVETYFLNLATNPQAEAVAARENASSAQAMRRLPQLVRAITTNNKLAESRALAGAVQSSLVRRLRTRNRLFQDLGVKQAPFMVLIGAQMPSVLAEIAFVSNRTEANLLKQNAYKQQIAQALCDAILQYRGSLKKVATVAASAEGR